MTIRLLVSSCAAMTLSASIAIAQSPRPQSSTTDAHVAPGATPITVTGCLVRPSDTSAHPTGSQTPAGGTVARTNEGSAAGGSANRGPANAQLLLLVTTTAATRPVGTSAVPGSIPSGTDSGTVPTQTIVGTSGTSSDNTAFVVTGDEHLDIDSHVGQRVEISGMRSEPSRAAADTRVVRRGERTAGTRSEGTSSSPAHPSAELPRIAAATVKPVGGSCEPATTP